MLGKFHGQRGLEGHSPRGHKRLDVTEHSTQHSCKFIHENIQRNSVEIQDIVYEISPIYYFKDSKRQIVKVYNVKSRESGVKSNFQGTKMANRYIELIVV